mgnify:CR=1 FL=1
MELLRLKTAYCSSDDRNDLSHTVKNVVAVIVHTLPSDVVILGRIFPHGRSQATDENIPWWLLGYSMKFHIMFAQAVSCKHPAHIMSTKTLLRTVKGATCTFDASEWRAEVHTDKLFYELGRDSLNDAAVLASFISFPPERFSVELGYSLFKVDATSDVLLPYVTDWVELDILSGVRFIDVPDGVKHIAITTSLDAPLIRLPDSIISCYIHSDVSVQLSIPRRFAKNWGYWSAVWGKPYMIKDGFSCSPDGLVCVRP